MRNLNFDGGKHYHLYNTGAGEQSIFLDNQDIARFIFLILFFVSPAPIYNTNWYINSYLSKGHFPIGKKKALEITEGRYVDLNAFYIDKKGFHLLIKNLSEGVASVYMHRILTSYSKYFSSKYKKRGRVFNGPFLAKFIGNKDIASTIRNIHRKHLETVPVKDPKCEPIISSHEDYTKKNRWGEYLKILSI